MGKRNYILFFLLLTAQLSAQKSSGRVTYKIANIDFIDKGQNADVTAVMSMARKQNYQLSFNNDHTSFKLLEAISDENFSEFHNKLAQIYVSDNDCYFDYINKQLIEQGVSGEILEQKLIEIPWKLTSESKTVDQYQCYKATYTFEYLARDQKMKTRVITAWFAPSLPYAFGPKNYYGLPGLILELTDSTVTFLVSKIELFEAEIEIKFPKGVRIDKETYLEEIRNR